MSSLQMRNNLPVTGLVYICQISNVTIAIINVIRRKKCNRILVAESSSTGPELAVTTARAARSARYLCVRRQS